MICNTEDAGCLRLQKTVAVAVHRIDGLVIGDTDVVGLDADKFSQLGMNAIHDDIPFAPSTYRHEPEV